MSGNLESSVCYPLGLLTIFRGLVALCFQFLSRESLQVAPAHPGAGADAAECLLQHRDDGPGRRVRAEVQLPPAHVQHTQVPVGEAAAP